MSGLIPESHLSTPAEWGLGWRVVVAAAVGAAAGLILYPFVSSLFIKHHTAAFEWTRGEASFASVASLIAGSLAPLVGRLADKIGIRPVIVLGAIGFACACVGMSLQDGNIWLYYVLTFLLVFFGLGTTSITWARPVNAVFVRSRGLALSTALSSVTLTAAVTPPLLNMVMEAHGWRAGWVMLGLLVRCWGFYCFQR